MQISALQPGRAHAPRRLIEELTLQVYGDLPFGTNPADASIAEGLTYVALAARLSGQRAASVELHAVALSRLLEEEGIDSWIYRFGLAEFKHVGVLALSDDGPIFLDSFTGLVLREPIWAALNKLSQGKAIDAAQLGRARKRCCIDPALETQTTVEMIARHAERELVGENQRVFSIAWGPELYVATQPEAQDAMAILGRMGAPRTLVQLLLYPLSVQEGEKVAFWLDDMPVIGDWFAGKDLPEGQDLPAHRLASRDRIALATTLAEQARARLDFREMQQRNDLAAQAREDLGRLQAAAEFEQQRTNEWRERAAAAETMLLEVRDQVVRLSEARTLALEESQRSEQRQAEWRERATAAEVALTDARDQIARLTEAQAIALEETQRFGQGQAEWRERATAAEIALTDAHDQMARLTEAQALAVEEAQRFQQGQAEWRERATAAETALLELHEQVDRLSREETAARDQALRLEQRVIQLRAEVAEVETARAAQAGRADAADARASEAARDSAQLHRELKLTRGRAVRALEAAAREASHLQEQLRKAETRAAAAEAHVDELREALDVQAARSSEDAAAALRWVEEARNEVAKERQARQEAEWRIHDQERNIQGLLAELAKERAGRELDLLRVEEGRRLAYAAQARLEREAETLRAALLNAPPSRPRVRGPVEVVDPISFEAALVDRLRANVAVAEGERDAAAQDRSAAQIALERVQAALDAQSALLARSRYMRLRSRLLRLFNVRASSMAQPGA